MQNPSVPNPLWTNEVGPRGSTTLQQQPGKQTRWLPKSAAPPAIQRQVSKVVAPPVYRPQAASPVAQRSIAAVRPQVLTRGNGSGVVQPVIFKAGGPKAAVIPAKKETANWVAKKPLPLSAYNPRLLDPKKATVVLDGRKKETYSGSQAYNSSHASDPVQMQPRRFVFQRVTVPGPMGMQQWKNRSIQRKSNPTFGRTIQLAPGPAFSLLAPRAGGTAIPTDINGKWVRPAWLRGAPTGAMTIRNEKAATLTPAMTVGTINFYRCGLCGQAASLNGLSVDHASDWKVWCEGHGAVDLQTLETAYHDMDNLHLVHNNCNSSKQTKDVFDWWRHASSANYLDPTEHKRIVDALQRIYQSTGVDWLYELEDGVRLQVLNGIIFQATATDAFQHLMGNAKIASSLKTW